MRVTKALPEFDTVVVPGATRATAEALRALPQVQSVEQEHRYQLRYTPNDPSLSQQEPAVGTPPGTPYQWWIAREGFPAAWDTSRGGGAKLAVIDTGIDGTHPDFAGRISASTDFDADHTTPATFDEQGHGTHVASIACANGNDGRGLVGAAFGCSLLIYKTDLSDSSVAQSIKAATDAGALAINMSFGTDGSRPASDVVASAIDYAYAHDVVMVAAAADDPVTEQGDPSNVLQPTDTGADITKGKGLDVTAATAADGKASFAGFGTQISMAAYGAWQQGSGGPRGLLGAFPSNQTDLENPAFGTQACNCRTTYNGDTRYAYLQGTSMAAPQVTAAAAMVRHLNPDLSARDVIMLLKKTARRPSGTWTPELGWGILDAASAIAGAKLVDRRPPRTSVTAPRTTRLTKVTLRIRSADAGPKNVAVSGVRSVRIYRRIGTGRWVKVATTTKPTIKVNVRRGQTSAFYSRGVDKAGNVEGEPSKPDARVRGR